MGTLAWLMPVAVCGSACSLHVPWLPSDAAFRGAPWALKGTIDQTGCHRHPEAPVYEAGLTLYPDHCPTVEPAAPGGSRPARGRTVLDQSV